MENILIKAGIIIGFVLPMLLLIIRKVSWVTNKFRFFLTGTLFIIGFLGLILLDNKTNGQNIFFKYIQFPFIHSLLDRFLKYLSFKMHGRDFIFIMKGSNDLVNGEFPESKPSDHFFSLILIFSAFFSWIFIVIY